MAQPSEKSEQVEQTLTALTGIDRRPCISASVCTWCGSEATDFRNALSEREYAISGFCQKCQDNTFGED